MRDKKLQLEIFKNQNAFEEKGPQTFDIPTEP